MQLHFTKMHGCGNDYIYPAGIFPLGRTALSASARR